MISVAEIRQVMVNESGPAVEELDHITNDVIASRVNAVEVDPGPATVNGNRLISDGATWTWEDSPDPPCGHTRIWRHVRKAGGS